MQLLKVILAASVILVAADANCRAQTPSAGSAAAAVEQSIVDVIKRAEPCVVAISRVARVEPSIVAPLVDDPFGELREPADAIDQTETTGAGVVIDPAGLVLTQYLAVREGDEHSVTTVDRRTYPAVIKAADPRSGLAVLQIIPLPTPPPPSPPPASPLQRAASDANQRTFPALALGDASELRKGQFVVVLGNPYSIRSDGEPSASWGIVTNLGRKAPAGENLNNVPGPGGDYRTTLHHLGTLLQTDAKLGWNAAGGAVLNLRGELVGLTTTVAEIAGHEQPAGYAIPIDSAIRRAIDTLKQGREVEYGLLGVTFRPTPTPDDAPARPAAGGVSIQTVYPGSPAASAGLEPNDVITQIVGKAVDSIDGVQLAVGTLPPGETVDIEYRRDGRPRSTTARLAKLAVPGKVIVTERPPAWRGMRVDFATALDAQTLADRSTAGAIDPQGCVVVTEVEQNSAAWQAGVRPGMFVSHVGSQRVGTPDEFRAAVKAIRDGVTLRFTEPVRSRENRNQQEIEVR